MNNKLSIVVTMAGRGSRFKKAGYKIPKYMITAKGKTLFDWSISSLVDFHPYVEKYVFVVQKNECAENFIREHTSIYDIKKIEIIEIDGITDGQATTAMLAVPYIDSEIPLMIYNIDTYVEPPGINPTDISGDGFIPCFNAPGDHWSFVSLDENGYANHITEKVRISDNCSIGAYYFSSAALFGYLYNRYYLNTENTDNLKTVEKYIAPMYNLLIEEGGKVRISNIDKSLVHVLGTPDELDEFLRYE